MANPDVEGFIRRAGSEMGVFATQTNKGDIHVSLRPPEDDPISLLTKSVRPPLDELKKELKTQGKELDEKEREKIRKRYRRRSTQDVMDEIDDEIKDHFSEHQLQHEMEQIMQDELGDLAGEGKPIEIRIYGPDQTQLRRLAQQVADKLEEKDTEHALDGVNSNVTAGNADLPITVDQQEAGRLGLTPEAVRRQMAAMFTGQIAAQAPESSVRVTNVRVRYPDALSRPRLVQPVACAAPSGSLARGQGVGARHSAGPGPRRTAVRPGARDADADADWRCARTSSRPPSSRRS